MVDNTVQDCFGVYHDSQAPECKICIDAAKCRNAMRGKKLQYSNDKTTKESMMAKFTLPTTTVEAVLNELGVSFEKKSSSELKSLYRVSNEKHKHYLDISVSNRGLKIYSKFAVDGASVNEKDARPYSLAIDSEDTFCKVVTSSVQAAV